MVSRLQENKEFFTKNNIDFEYINIDITPEALPTQKVIIRENESFQTVLINDTHSNPQNYELAQTLGSLTSRAKL
jgi:thioredoxin reductase (NADPH)